MTEQDGRKVVRTGGNAVLVTFAFETLDDVRRREFCRPPDQLLLEILKDERTSGVVIVDPWRSRIADIVRRRSGHPDTHVMLNSVSIRHIRPLRLRLGDPTSIPALKSQYERYGKVVRKTAGPVDTVITAHPFIAAWAARFMGVRCIYYARDDWAGHPFFERWWLALDHAQRKIGDGDHEIFAVSETLGERLRPHGPVTVVPNGVSAEVWRERQMWPLLHVAEPRSYAIYSGSIDSRLDLALLAQITRHPRIDCVVVAGPIESADLRERLQNTDGIVLLGNLDQATLAAVTTNASVGVLPHVRSRQTTASSPLKLYEYLAGGLPVVTVDLTPVDDLGDRVQGCRDASEWQAALHKALDQGRATEPERRSTLDALCWARRLRPIVDSALRVENRPAREG